MSSCRSAEGAERINARFYYPVLAIPFVDLGLLLVPLLVFALRIPRMVRREERTD